MSNVVKPHASTSIDFTVSFSFVIWFTVFIYFRLVIKMNAEKYFNTRNLYTILELDVNAQIQDGKINGKLCT